MAEKKPIPVIRTEAEASQLLKPNPTEHSRLIAVVEVNPRSQPHVSLGNFTADAPPVGFTLEITPEDYDPETIVAQITRLDAAFDEYELVLHLANYSDRAASVDVLQLLPRSVGS